MQEGQGHAFPNQAGWVGRYRVAGSYFQAVYAKRENPVFTALASMDPVETEDDAGWEIWRVGEDGGPRSQGPTRAPGRSTARK